MADSIRRFDSNEKKRFAGPYLKLFTEGALTTCCGRLFQCGTTRWLKKYFRTWALVSTRMRFISHLRPTTTIQQIENIITC